MKSKTSCFNKTIFWKNVARFWPIWASYLAILFFSMPVSLFLRTRPNAVSSGNVSSTADKLGSMLECISGNLMPVFVFVFAILSAIAVFSYLYSARNCNMIHSLPVKRDELFFTNYLSGISFLFVPQIIIFLLSLFVCIINNVTSVEYLFYWLIYTVGMSFFFFSSAVFFCLLTGQYFAGFAYYLLGNCIYATLKYLIASIVATLCYGLTGVSDIYSLANTKDMCLSPIVYLSGIVKINWEYDADFYDITRITISGGNAIALYCIPAAALTLLALFLYRKRQLECAGDIVAFSWMKPIFRWLVAFCAGIGFSIIFTQLFFVDSRYAAFVLILSTILFSCVCFFLAEMLLRKRFKVFQKKRWIEWGACICVILFIFGAINGDIFRLERKVPDTKEVSAALIDSDYSYSIVLTAPDEIEKIKDIHQTIIDNKKSYEHYYYDHMNLGRENTEPSELVSDAASEAVSEETKNSTEGTTFAHIKILYYLKNGRTITRSYYIPATKQYLDTPDSAAGQIREMQHSSDAYLKYMICDNYEDVHYDTGTFSYMKDDDYEYRDLTAGEVHALYEALKKDIQSGNYPYGIGNDTMNAGNTYCESITLEGKIDGKFISIFDAIPTDEGKELREANAYTYSYSVSNTGRGKNITNVSTSFPITDSCEHTIQALIDLGIIRDRSELTYQEDSYAASEEMYE